MLYNVEGNEKTKCADKWRKNRGPFVDDDEYRKPLQPPTLFSLILHFIPLIHFLSFIFLRYNKNFHTKQIRI